MNWLRRIVHRLFGEDKNDKQTQEVTAALLQSQLRKRRVERLSAELEMYRRGPHAH